MTDDELEARMRRATERLKKGLTDSEAWSVAMNEAIAILESMDPPADPFEEWWAEQRWSDGKAQARTAWDAATAHEREQCAKIADAQEHAGHVNVDSPAGWLAAGAIAERIRARSQNSP